MKRTAGRIGLGLTALTLLATPAIAQDTPAANVPVLPDSYGTVVIGDLSGLLDRAGELASVVMPSFKKDMLRQQFGAMAGDPGLTGLPAGSGVAVVMPRSGLPFAFIEVSADKIGAYETLLKQRGLTSIAQVEGLLVGGANPASLDAAKRFAAGVKSQVLQGNGQPSLIASVKLAEVLKQYEPQVQGMMKNFAAKMEEATTATASTQLKSAESMLRVYYALGKRIDLMTMSFAPSTKGLQMDYVVTPVGGGSAESAALPAEVAGPAMVKLLPGDSGLRGEYTFDPKWVAGPLTTTFADALKESGISAEQSAEFVKWMQSSMTFMAGGMAMNFAGDPENPMSGAYAMSVTDEQAAIAFLKEMPGKMESTGMADFYKNLGMPATLTFKENTAEHQGIAIHQLDMKMDLSALPARDKAGLEKMANITYDVAVVNKVLLYAIQPFKIGELIDSVKAGSHPEAKPLVSKGTLPKDGRFYVDYNIGAVMGLASMGSGGNSAVKKMSAALKDAAPVQIGGYNEAGKYRMVVLVPAATMKAFTQRDTSAPAEGTVEGASTSE